MKNFIRNLKLKTISHLTISLLDSNSVLNDVLVYAFCKKTEDLITFKVRKHLGQIGVDQLNLYDIDNPKSIVVVVNKLNEMIDES